MRQARDVCLLIMVLVCASARSADAIPVFARQMDLVCTDCHTLWPRLGQDARTFKVGGYVLRSPTGNTRFPFAVALSAQATTEATGATGSPTSTTDLVTPISSDFYTGGAFGPKLGAFVDLNQSIDSNGHLLFNFDHIKVAYSLNTDHPASINFIKGGPFSADPYVLGDFDRMPFLATEEPLFMSNGFLAAPADLNNYGLVLHGYVGKENHWYGAVGLETSDQVQDPLAGVNRLSSDPLKGYVDVTYDNTIGKHGNWNATLAYYQGNVSPQIAVPSINGSEVPFNYSGNISRFFFTGEIQLPVNKNDEFEFVGAYCNGHDNNFYEFDPTTGAVSPNGPINQNISGAWVQSDYWWDKRYGVLASYDSSTIGPTVFHTLAVGLAWRPRIEEEWQISAGLQRGSDGSTDNLVGIWYERYLFKKSDMEPGWPEPDKMRQLEDQQKPSTPSTPSAPATPKPLVPESQF